MRWVVGGVFLVAGGLKLADPAEFGVDIHNYRLLPYRTAVLLAVYLPWLEILCGTFLILRRLQSAVLLLLLLLLLLFTAALVSAWVRGIDIACGCFGSGSHIAYPWSVLRNLALLGGIVLLGRAEDT